MLYPCYFLLIEELILVVCDFSIPLCLLQQQVVAGGYVVVFVGVYALEHMVFLETQLHQSLKNHHIDGYLRQPYEYASCDSWQWRR